MIEDIQAAIPLGFLLAFMIGPVFFVLLETSATKGFRAGLFFDLGVILADITTFFNRDYVKGRQDIKPRKGGSLSLFVKGFLLNFINVGVLVFWLGVIIIVGPSLDNKSDRIIVFFSAMLAAYFITDIFKILLAKQLRRKLTTERIRLVKKILGVILVICGLVLIIKGFLPKDKLNIEQGIEYIRE